jgi:hypothetical protein
MSRGVCLFKQSDVTKAIKGAHLAGLSVARVEIGVDGRIVVVAGMPGQSSVVPERNEWDARK